MADRFCKLRHSNPAAQVTAVTKAICPITSAVSHRDGLPPTADCIAGMILCFQALPSGISVPSSVTSANAIALNAKVSPAGAQSQADGGFPPPRLVINQAQVGQVGRGNQQHQEERGEQQRGRGDLKIHVGKDCGYASRFRLQTARLELAQNDIFFAAGLLGRDAGPQPRGHFEIGQRRIEVVFEAQSAEECLRRHEQIHQQPALRSGKCRRQYAHNAKGGAAHVERTAHYTKIAMQIAAQRGAP